MLSDRINLSDLAAQLGYRDTRLKAVKRWCANNALNVFTAGKLSYVLRHELEQIFATTEVQQKTVVLLNPKKQTAMKNAISIPKAMKVEGLFMTCNICKTNYSTDDAVKCKHPLKYKARISVKIDGKYTNKSRVLEAKNYQTAVLEWQQFKAERGLNDGSVGCVPITSVPINLPLYEKPINQYTIHPRLTLVDAIQTYMDYLNNVGIPAHLKKPRSEHNNTEAEIMLSKIFLGALKANNVSDQTPFTSIDDKIVGMVFEYTQKYSNKYFTTGTN